VINELLKRIERLEYHERLLVDLLQGSNKLFTKLIISKNLDESEVKEFHRICENLNNKMENQKAEGFLYFHPLLKEFSAKISPKLDISETIHACIEENLYVDLMLELRKYL